MDGVTHPSVVRAGLFHTDLAVYKTGGLLYACCLKSLYRKANTFYSVAAKRERANDHGEVPVMVL